MNLNKIVNKINGQDVNIRWNHKNYKYSDSDTPVEAKVFVEKNLFNKEIHIVDLLLALNKINYIDIQFGDIKVPELIIKHVGYGKGEICAINLESPLSKQKPEVTKKLIEILS